MADIITTSAFLRTLLMKCIGTVMIEWEQWDFPQPSFDRGYFNDRLKRPVPVNTLTRQRLKRLFENVFSPDNRKGKFQEPQAVEAANAFISLAEKYFHINLSVWENNYTTDNSTSRSHLLSCLDVVLGTIEGTELLPSEKIADSLNNYMTEIHSAENMPAPTYPKLLTPAPCQQASNFFGRQNTTSFLMEQLLSGHSCYLHGIGGIGKTEIAKSVLKQILSMTSSSYGFTHIVWVNYTDGDFALSLVRALNLDGTINNMEQAFQKAVSIINQYHENLLLIIDNVENADDEHLLGLCGYLNCRFLITIRCEGFPSFTKIPVPALSENDCMTLFYSYYFGQKDDIMLKKIIQLADRHTVTIELLAKIADSEEVLLYEFYDSLVQCGFHISAEEVTTAHEKMHSEGRIIEQLKKLFAVYGCSPEAQHLLIQISTIPNIQFGFEKAKKWFDLKNRTPLNQLAKKGWIKKEPLYDNGRQHYLYYMHSVIASAIRAQFTEKLYQACQSFIYEITLEMKEIRSQNDAAKKELIQFSWSLNDIFQGQFHSENDCDFLWALAEIYRDIGYYKRAVPLLDLLFKLYTELYGDDCIQLGSVFNSKGMIAYNLSHFDAALDFYQKSRDIIDEHITPEAVSSLAKIELAKLDLNIGKTYLKTDYHKAGTFFDRAYDVLLLEEGRESQLTQNALAHKAMFLEDTGHLLEAENIYEEIYNQNKEDTDDYDTLLLRASVAHHIGNIYSDYAPDKAMPFLMEAKDILWNILSPTHPDTLDVLNSICSLELTTKDNYPEVLSDLQHLLELFIKAYGPDDPQVGTIHNNIGLCFYYMGQPAEAVRNYRKAIQINISVYGEDHPSTAYIYNNIGAAYSETEHPEKAIPEHEHALKIYKTAYPDKLNLDFALTHADLAGAYLLEGSGDKTMEHLNEAFDIYQKMLPENAHQLIYPYCTLANLMTTLGNYETAITSYSHTIWLLLENGYTEDSPAVQEFAVKINDLQQIQNSEEPDSSL